MKVVSIALEILEDTVFNKASPDIESLDCLALKMEFTLPSFIVF